jgi:DNA polymerase III epsilon subunit family exonuclease
MAALRRAGHRIAATAGSLEAERSEAERSEAERSEAERSEAGRAEAGRAEAGRAEAGTCARAAPALAPGPLPQDGAAGGPEPGGAAAAREPGDGQHFRLLSGLLPADPFLPAGDLVVVDVETTGWLADEAGITEIGAVRLSPGQPAAEFSALVNPGRPIPANITDLTGITDEMVAGAPAIAEILPKFLDFAAGGVIVAHNAPFDLAFLAAACEQCGIAWPSRAVVDTAVLSRLVLGSGDVPDHRLATLSCHFDVRTGPCHRALADARATAAVLRGLLRLLARGPRPACGPTVYLPRASRPAVAAVTGEPSRYDVAPAGAHEPRNEEAAMVTAIVLIKADVTRIPETAEAIAQIQQVSEVYSVTGEFDLVAMVRVRAHDELGDVIPGHVNKVPGVTHTETHIAFRTYSRHDLDAAFSIGYPENA